MDVAYLKSISRISDLQLDTVQMCQDGRNEY